MQKQGLEATGILANLCKRTGVESVCALLDGSSQALLAASQQSGTGEAKKPATSKRKANQAQPGVRLAEYLLSRTEVTDGRLSSC